MRSWILLVVVLALVAHAAADEEESDWETFKTESVLLRPNSCNTVTFKVDERSGYRLTVEPKNVPSKCSLEDDVEITSEVYYKGQCLEFDSQGDKCRIPSSSGIERKEQMCDNWSDLSTVPYTSDFNDPTISTTTGLICFGGDDYFFSLRSGCAEEIELEIKVEKRETTESEEAVCDLLQNFLDAAKTVATVMIIIVVVVIVCIVGGIIACCCLCSGCPCYWKNRRAEQHMGQPMGVVNHSAYTASQKVQTNQH